MAIERILYLKDWILGFVYGKDETYTQNQVRDYVTDAISTFSVLVDEKLGRKSDKGHKHVKSDVTDLKDVTSSASGLMTPTLLSKLNNIEEGANKIIIDNKLDSTSIRPVQNKVICNEFYNKDDIIDLLNNIQTAHGKLLSLYIDDETGDLVVEDDGFNYYTATEIDDNFTVSVEKQAIPESGFLSTYVIKQGSKALSPKINIPKDFLVKSATLETVNVKNNPVNGYNVGDKYFDFVINSKDNTGIDEHLYLNVNTLVDVYTADESSLTVNNNQFSVKNKGISSNHLSDGLTDLIGGKVDKEYGKGLSTNDFTVSDKNKLNGIENEANKITKTSELTNDSGFLTSHQSLSDYVQKSDTPGLLRNDGNVDTNSYLTTHQDITGKVDKIAGKGLSTNDYTNSDKSKVGEIDNKSDIGHGHDFLNLHEIVEDSDLNDIDSPGIYLCSSSAIAGTINNCPVNPEGTEHDKAFGLIVVETARGSTFSAVKQIVLPYYYEGELEGVYIRSKYSTHNGQNIHFGEWKTIHDSGNSYSKTEIDAKIQVLNSAIGNIENDMNS